MWQVVFLVQIVYTYSPVINRFEGPDRAVNHLAINYETGTVYVGAVNNLYQLSSDLNIVHRIITGPVNDSAMCYFECADVALELKDNFNKALVIDYVHNRLISCGSVFQGMCWSRSLGNIHFARAVPLAVVADQPAASTVLFLAPGPPDPDSTLVLYAGVTYTGGESRRYEVPAVSTRSLEEHRLFEIAETFCEYCHSDQVSGTRMYINTMYRDQYIVNYVYGFSSGVFSYFLITQQRPSGGYYSKIVRICHNDHYYNSYTEIQMSCKRNENNDYNIVEAGLLTEPNEKNARNYRKTSGQDVLYTLFRRSPTTAAKISALCVYTIKEINEKIDANIEKCSNGEGMRGLEYILPNRKCLKHKLGANETDNCSYNINSPLGGDSPIEARPIAEFNDTLTALALLTNNTHTKVFAGTARGHIKKIMLENNTNAFEFGNIIVDEGSPVGKDLFFDIQQRHLYVITGRNVSKVRIHECSEHTSCTDCVTSEEPYNYCGWCYFVEKCMPRADCKNESDQPLFWFPHGLGPCEVPDQYEPIPDERIVRNFTNPVLSNSSLFTHLGVDHITGRVYVGAVNRIYQLSSELDIIESAVTGPVHEFQDLNNFTDNVNKVLIIDYTRSRLITCGSVHKGVCSVRALYNISRDVRQSGEEIGLIPDLDFSPVAFVVRFPPNPLPTEVLYLGALSFDNTRFNYPVVKSRSLQDHDLFKTSYNGLDTSNALFTDHFNNGKKYAYSYIHGFTSGSFSYILRTQVSRFNQYSTTIIRTCHENGAYSYIEMSITCEEMWRNGETSYVFSNVMAAFVGKIGFVLAEELELTLDDDVLFTVFRQRPTANPSILCLYPLKKINHMFRQSIKKYYSEHNLQNPDCIESFEHCYTDVNLESITEEFCGPMNTPIWRGETIVAIAVLGYSIKLTAVAATIFGNYTVIIAGTDQGHLKIITVDSAITAVEHDDFAIDEGFSVNRDLFFDTPQKHLYALTKNKLFKVKVHQCDIYRSCSACVKATEPFCGWCVIESKCCAPSECEDFTLGPLYWLPHGSRQCSVSISKKHQLLPSPKNTMPIFIDPVSEAMSLFNHLVVDRLTDSVYVGAVDRIYHLSADLQVVKEIATGPVDDPHYCFPDCPAEVLNTPTDNVNIVLLIDYTHSRLINCGSVSRGTCSVKAFSNISKDATEPKFSIMFPNAILPPVAFIAPGPPNPPTSQAMYVGLEISDGGFPVISSRSLEDNNLFGLSYKGLNTNTTVYFDHFSKEHDTHRFAYGFSSGRFIYFIRKVTKGGEGLLRVYYSNIVSVCYEDFNQSYIEIPISCKRKRSGSVTYNYSHMMAGFVSKPGLILAKKLGITIDDDILFAAFHAGPGIISSALCIYPIKKIRQLFAHNIQMDVSGIDERLGKDLGSLNCSSQTEMCNKKPESINEDFCGPVVNSPLWGEEPLEALPTATFTSRVTALAVTRTSDHTVVFVGNDQGRLEKLVVKSARSAYTYSDIVVDDGSPVNKDLFFNSQHSHLYVMTERKVSKISVQQCSEYTSFVKCVGSRDPYCAWCEDDEKCGLKSECE